MDYWCGQPLHLEACLSFLAEYFISTLSKVSKFIYDRIQNFPDSLTYIFTFLQTRLPTTLLSDNEEDDQTIWPQSSFGVINLEEAYIFKSKPPTKIP